MKYFLVKVKIGDGEMEYNEALTVKANTFNEAEEIVSEQTIRKELSYGKGDYRIFEVASIREIGEKEAKLLSDLGLSYCINI